MKSDLARNAGQMLLAGFDGTSLPRSVETALSRSELGGVILFARNIVEPRQVAELNLSAQSAAEGHPLPFISVDQEGGRVQRLKEPLTRVPPMFDVGRAGDARLATRVGSVLGEELEALGFNLDYAPDADVWTNPENTVIGDRAFSTDPAVVARYAGALALGLLQSGIVPCAKHFPGHGDTLLDSHLDLPVVQHDLERLDRIELEPFRSLIRGGIPMIMTAHILVPSIDTRHPITFSENGLQQLLRNQLGYQGVIISDDLEMKAVADRYDVEEMVALGLRAGIDIFLVCRSEEMWTRAFETLVKLGEKNSHDRDRIAASANRVVKLKLDLLRPWSIPDDLEARLGTPEHQMVVAEVRARAGER
jgi:beta-N-acetylhexosaminidase